jgi:hypothetical protein
MESQSTLIILSKVFTTIREDIQDQLEGAEGNMLQITKYSGEFGITLKPKLPIRWKSTDYIKVDPSSIGNDYRFLMNQTFLSDFKIIVGTITI